MTPTTGHGKICYVEMPANDIARSAEFYEKGLRLENAAARRRRDRV
jgi:predicted enzyme related to lactoylglutathione lyase